MSAPAAATGVHVEIPGFQAISEQGHWDACAVVAELDALHVCTWRNEPLVENTIDAWRWQYVQAIDPATKKPRWTSGQGTTLGNIHWHLTETAIHAHLAGYIPYSDSPDLAKLHTFIKSHMVAQNPVIIEVSNAAALPHAEPGVRYHFVTLGGIDSVQGYLVASGDTLDAIRGKAGARVPTYWATWAQLTQAGVCGAIALQRVVAPPPPPPPPSPIPPIPPIGLQAAITQAEALLAALRAMAVTP